MALSGSFQNYPTGQFGLYCEWSGAQNQSGNYTDITLKVYLRIWDIYVGARSDSTISINGVSETYTAPEISDSGGSWHFVQLKTKTVRVFHNANGTKTGVPLSASWRMSGTYSGVSIGTITASTTIDLNPITTYKLSMSAGAGSNITVNRTASGYAGTGNLSNGAILYKNDNLKITFTPSANYAILGHTVNGATFASGNTHTVSGNVSVASTAQVLASAVGATDANIGSISTVTVTKYNSSYYHSLSYNFGGLTGYITSSGGVQATEAKFSNTSIAFSIPTSFYAKIPNSKTGTCTITCRTYSSANSTTVLGNASTCSITVTATGSPVVSGTVIDNNDTTIALTGDSRKLIRYKSTAVATIDSVAKNSASIWTKYINGVTTPNDKRTFTSVEETSFRFKATDTRGYSTEVSVYPTIIAYVNLSINPIIARPTPTGSQMSMTFSGNVYRGSFGLESNSLRLKYRYRESNEASYGDWVDVPQTDIIYGTASFSSNGTLILDGEFNYHKDYLFQVNVSDGTPSIPLSSVTKTMQIPRGEPVFDWGENDFNFNVPVRMSLENVTGDLNNYKDGGIYHYDNSGATNAPGGAGVLEVISPKKGYVIQRFTEYASGCRLFVRSFYDGTTWTAWVQK